MSKIKLLLDVSEDMQRLSESFRALAESMTDDDEAPAAPVQEAQPAKPVVPKVTIDQVRAVLAEKSGEGKTAGVKELLYKYDAGKLSGVKPEDYGRLLEEAQKL